MPANIRKTLGILAGTPIRFVERDGVVMLEKVDINLSGLYGMATARQSASLEEMNQAIGDAVAERDFGDGLILFESSRVGTEVVSFDAIFASRAGATLLAVGRSDCA